MTERPSREDEVRRAYEESETRLSSAMEELVARDSFGELLAWTTGNAMALARLGFETLDLVVRNLRLAGRRDIASLGRQVGRTEDKLELVLQAVERLEDELQELRGRAGAGLERLDKKKPTRRRPSSSA